MEKREKEIRKEEIRKKKLEKFNEKLKIQDNEKKTKKKETINKIEHDLVTYDIKTALGEKKDTINSLPIGYSPNFVEACWYDWWLKMGLFKPVFKNDESEKFIMCLPPPNVTGTLHLGHALTIAIQDSLARWHRMSLHETLWIPGSDHAGIATQVIVEKQLQKSSPVTPNIRQTLGRQTFIKKVWEWKHIKGNEICNQEKALGASLDWSMEYFTMDQKFSSAVVECFVRLHEQGLIYRSNRLVNWSCSLKSAISDIEVEKREINTKTLLKVPNFKDGVEVGILSYFAYKVMKIDTNSGKVNDEDEIVVATTRLETMLGDTGIAVNPQDKRYSKYLSHNESPYKYQVIHPFSKDRLIPIVFDKAIDIHFGTGAVKITPAHDFDDYEIGLRHNLATINIFTEDGRMNEHCGPFIGLHRFEARILIEKHLNDMNLFRGKKEHSMLIPICSRSKDIIEPMIKPQWYLSCSEMAINAKQAVAEKRLILIPSSYDVTWNTWMNNIRDWCISRQLWWGHRIPAYKISHTFSKEDDDEIWIAARNENEALIKAKNILKTDELNNIRLIQDEDVLDTWFSSALVPLATLGWPNIENDEFQRYFPNTFLETGHDILFFWVARMVFLSQKLTGLLPFRQVFLHAMIRDAHGRKMSKSLGNIIDPIDVIKGITLKELNEKLLIGNLEETEYEKAKQGQKIDFPNGIPQCGTDALRFALCAYTNQGKDINLDVNRIVGYRHFCNKIWNATKFVLNILNSQSLELGCQDFHKMMNNEGREFQDMDTWILQMLSECVEKCDKGFREYNFQLVTNALHNYWLYQFCDIYIEYAKPYLYDKLIPTFAVTTYKDVIKRILLHCLYNFLKLLHPFMPFITEELYQRIIPHINFLYKDHDIKQSISISTYPNILNFNYCKNLLLNETIALIMNTIKGIRNIRQEYNILKADLEVNILCMMDHPVNDANTIICQIKNLKNFIISSTAPLKELNIKSIYGDHEPYKNCIYFTSPLPNYNFKCITYISLEGLIDVDKERNRLMAKQSKLLESLDHLKRITSDPNYNIDIVGSQVIQINENKMTSYKTEMQDIEKLLSNLHY
ncbi:unnamed protein product [Gordionus sp. m RMFG-2023]|uniref:valine--tRNA ligase-like isoform X2 n=1 Tax=Gordionus sp. m RMFG-2023 TaxID=3053472 RepID=UPI0030E30134